MSRGWLALVLGAALGAGCMLAGSGARLGYQAAILDSVTFGDGASESAHGFAGRECVGGAGGLGEACRRLGPGGSMAFRLPCDRERQTYLSVRLWGSDRGQGQLYLHDGTRQVGRYLAAEPELDLLAGVVWSVTSFFPPTMRPN